jgi:tetratricopeptide (TPR) repeat protein
MVFCRVKIVLMMMLIVLLVLPSCGQKKLWEELNAKVTVLYQQGRYSEASNVAEEALKVAEETFGPNHLNVALSLNNLVVLYQDQGKYAEAEPLFKRALEIEEKALPPLYDGVGEYGKVLHREWEGR